MSHLYTKIQYCQEGSFGSFDEHTLYCHHNDCCDIVTFYRENGEPIFSFEDTLAGNIFDKMVEIIHDWNPEKNQNVKLQTIEEMNKCRNYVPPEGYVRYSEKDVKLLLDEQRRVCANNIEKNSEIPFTSEGYNIIETIIERSEIKEFDKILKNLKQ
jgi:hypothetical protein